MKTGFYYTIKRSCPLYKTYKGIQFECIKIIGSWVKLLNHDTNEIIKVNSDYCLNTSNFNPQTLHKKLFNEETYIMINVYNHDGDIIGQVKEYV